MGTYKKQLNAYYKRIKNLLICSFIEKRIFINAFRNDVMVFADTYPDTTFEDIVKEFGQPEEIVKGFEINRIELRKKAKKRLILEIVGVIVFLVVIIIISFWLFTIGGQIKITGK